MADFSIKTYLDFSTEEVFFFVVPPVGQPPTVFVRYQNFSGGKPTLWQQHITGDAPPRWTPIRDDELVRRMQESNRRQARFPQGGNVAPNTGIDRIDNEGYIDAPVLRPGNIYRVWGTGDPNADPNNPDTDLSGMATVLAAGQRGTVLGAGGVMPEPQIDHLRLNITQTPAPVAHLAEIGRGQPATNQSHGFRFFRNPVGRVIDGVPRSTGSPTFGGLPPGETYTAVVRVMNTRGLWQEVAGEVTLLQRLVELTVDSVRIINDGDPGGAAEGYFRVDFFTGRWGDAPIHEVVRAFRFPAAGAGLAELDDGDVFGEGGSLHPTGPPWSAQIGPAPVSRNEFGVFLEVYDDDTEPFETDEYGRHYWEPADFTTPITDKAFIFTTRRSSGDVEAEARGRYSIRHVSPGPAPGPWQSVDVPAGADDFRVDADYDGDQKTDEAAYRPGSGVWFIAPSSGGLVEERKLGEPGDYPGPADYTGDGKADLAVWRPGQAKWLVQPSSGGAVIERTTGEDGTPVPPGELDGLFLFARSLATTAQRLSTAGRPGEAAAPARGAIDILLGQAAQVSPAQTSELVFLVGIYSGYLAPADAVGAVERAVMLAEQLAAAHPDEFDYQYRHAWVLCVLAQRLEAAGRRPEAADPSRTAIEIFLRLVPDASDAYTYDLIFQVGIFSGYLPPAEAVTAVQEAVGVAGVLAAHPDNFEYQYRNAWVLCVLAQRLEAAGRRPEAADPSRTAIEIFLRLAPDASDAYTYDLIFQVGIFSGYLPPAEAVAPVEQAVAIAQRLADANPDNPDYKERADWIREVLAQRQAAAGSG